MAKWSQGIYRTDGRATSWLNIKNPASTQMRDRHELFSTITPRGPRGGYYELNLLGRRDEFAVGCLFDLM